MSLGLCYLQNFQQHILNVKPLFQQLISDPQSLPRKLHLRRRFVRFVPFFLHVLPIRSPTGVGSVMSNSVVLDRRRMVSVLSLLAISKMSHVARQ